jgi:hypothetical protein
MAVDNVYHNGYVLPLTIKTAKYLNLELETEEEECSLTNPEEIINHRLEHSDTEYGTAIIDNEEFNIEIFYYDSSEGSKYDSIEEGHYIFIEEDILYTKSLTSIGKRLEKDSILPKLEIWSSIG